VIAPLKPYLWNHPENLLLFLSIVIFPCLLILINIYYYEYSKTSGCFVLSWIFKASDCFILSWILKDIRLFHSIMNIQRHQIVSFYHEYSKTSDCFILSWIFKDIKLFHSIRNIQGHTIVSFYHEYSKTSSDWLFYHEYAKTSDCFFLSWIFKHIRLFNSKNHYIGVTRNICLIWHLALILMLTA
jgi:hypothetical protein